jgi:hypothetical protein
MRLVETSMRKADHSDTSAADLRMSGAIPLLPHNTFMTWTGTTLPIPVQHKWLLMLLNIAKNNQLTDGAACNRQMVRYWSRANEMRSRHLVVKCWIISQTLSSYFIVSSYLTENTLSCGACSLLNSFLGLTPYVTRDQCMTYTKDIIRWQAATDWCLQLIRSHYCNVIIAGCLHRCLCTIVLTSSQTHSSGHTRPQGRHVQASEADHSH